MCISVKGLDIQGRIKVAQALKTHQRWKLLGSHCGILNETSILQDCICKGYYSVSKNNSILISPYIAIKKDI